MANNERTPARPLSDAEKKAQHEIGPEGTKELEKREAEKHAERDQKGSTPFPVDKR